MKLFLVQIRYGGETVSRYFAAPDIQAAATAVKYLAGVDSITEVSREIRILKEEK